MELKPDFKFNEHNIGVQDITNEADKLSEAAGISDNLKTVLATKEKLRSIKEREIKFSLPVLRQGENAVIFPNTINVIQGQAGVHKSRLAETVCAAFLKLHN